MGRGVDYLNNADEVTFFDVSSMGRNVDFDDDGEVIEVSETYDECLGREDWNDFVSNVKEALQKRYPSLEEVTNKWDGRETRIILENSLVELGISEYCGCASLSIRVKDNLDSMYSDIPYQLASNWINLSWRGMLKVLDKTIGYPRLGKIGTFSNGESVYEKIQ